MKISGCRPSASSTPARVPRRVQEKSHMKAIFISNFRLIFATPLLFPPMILAEVSRMRMAQASMCNYLDTLLVFQSGLLIQDIYMEQYTDLSKDTDLDCFG